MWEHIIHGSALYTAKFSILPGGENEVSDYALISEFFNLVILGT